MGHPVGEQGKRVEASLVQRFSRALFFQMPQPSFDRISQTELCVGGGIGRHTLRGLVSGWCAKHDLSFDRLADCQGRFRTCAAVPVPHLLLSLLGEWHGWAFPVASGGLSSSMGLKEAEPLLRAPSAQLQQASLDAASDIIIVEGTDEVDLLTKESLEHLVDVLRRCYATAPSREVAQ